MPRVCRPAPSQPQPRGAARTCRRPDGRPGIDNGFVSLRVRREDGRREFGLEERFSSTVVSASGGVGSVAGGQQRRRRFAGVSGTAVPTQRHRYRIGIRPFGPPHPEHQRRRTTRSGRTSGRAPHPGHRSHRRKPRRRLESGPSNSGIKSARPKPGQQKSSMRQRACPLGIPDRSGASARRFLTQTWTARHPVVRTFGERHAGRGLAGSQGGGGCFWLGSLLEVCPPTGVEKLGEGCPTLLVGDEPRPSPLTWPRWCRIGLCEERKKKAAKEFKEAFPDMVKGRDYATHVPEVRP